MGVLFFTQSNVDHTSSLIDQLMAYVLDDEQEGVVNIKCVEPVVNIPPQQSLEPLQTSVEVKTERSLNPDELEFIPK